MKPPAHQYTLVLTVNDEMHMGKYVMHHLPLPNFFWVVEIVFIYIIHMFKMRCKGYSCVSAKTTKIIIWLAIYATRVCDHTMLKMYI